MNGFQSLLRGTSSLLAGAACVASCVIFACSSSSGGEADAAPHADAAPVAGGELETSGLVLDFPDTPCGGEASRVAQATNIGEGPITVTAVRLVGAGGVLAIDDHPELPAIVAAGESLPVHGTYRPAHEQRAQARFELDYEDADGTHTATAAWRGLPVTCGLTFEPPTVSWDAVQAGKDGAPRTVVIRSEGSAFRIAEFRIETPPGNDAMTFSLLSTQGARRGGPLVVDADGEAEIVLGSHNHGGADAEGRGELVIRSEGAGAPDYRIPLYAAGAENMDCVVELEPSPVTLGTLVVDEQATGRLRGTVTGNGDCRFESVSTRLCADSDTCPEPSPGVPQGALEVLEAPAAGTDLVTGDIFDVDFRLDAAPALRGEVAGVVRMDFSHTNTPDGSRALTSFPPAGSALSNVRATVCSPELETASEHLRFGDVTVGCQGAARVLVKTTGVCRTLVEEVQSDCPDLDVQVFPDYGPEDAIVSAEHPVELVATWAPEEAGEIACEIDLVAAHDQATLEVRGTAHAPAAGQTKRTFEGLITEPPLDVLFVVDGPLRSALSGALSGFRDALLARSVRLRAGMISTRSPLLAGEPHWLGTEEVDALSHALGAPPSAGFAGGGLDMFRAAVTHPLKDAYNHGFRRSWTSFAVVFVVEGDDYALEEIETYAEILWWLTDSAGPTPRATAHVVVVPDEPCDPGEGVAEATRFAELVDAVGGTVTTTCSADLDDALTAVAEASSRVVAPVSFGGPVDPSTVDVTVDGQPCPSAGSWSVAGGDRWLVFEPEGACTPSYGDEYEVTWTGICSE